MLEEISLKNLNNNLLINLKRLSFLNIKRLNQNYLFAFVANHLIYYSTSVSLTYAWSFGFLAGMCLVTQMISGIFLAIALFSILFSHNFFNVEVEKASDNKKKESENFKNNNHHNKFLRNLCDNFILFNYSIIIKRENPFSIMIFIVVSVIGHQSFYFLKVYLIVVLSSAIFMDICYKFPIIGYPVCMFLKRHATPEFFALIGNSPFEAFFAKFSGPAIKTVAKPITVAVGVSLGADYVASTIGIHQASAHVVQDYLNGEKTVYKYDPTLNRKPYLDTIVESISQAKK